MGGPSSTEKSQSALANNAASTASAYTAASFPGFQAAEHYYRNLASGNTSLINQALAPQIDQIQQQYDARAQSAKKETPRGGAEGDLTGALANQRAGQLAELKSGAVASAIPALANLGVQGGNLSATDVYNALTAFGQVGQEQANSKGSQLGLAGGLAADVATVAAAGML